MGRVQVGSIGGQTPCCICWKRLHGWLRSWRHFGAYQYALSSRPEEAGATKYNDKPN